MSKFDKRSGNSMAKYGTLYAKFKNYNVYDAIKKNKREVQTKKFIKLFKKGVT